MVVGVLLMVVVVVWSLKVRWMMFVLADLILRRLRVAGACMEVRCCRRRIGCIRVHTMVVAAGRVACSPIGPVAGCGRRRMVRIGVSRVAVCCCCRRCRRRETAVLVVGRQACVIRRLVMRRVEVAIVVVGVVGR